MSKISHDLRFFTHVQKNYKNFLQILHQYIDFSLPSSTISSYFNSSYYSFLTFLTLYLIYFKISQNFFSPETQWGGFNPQNPSLPMPLTGHLIDPPLEKCTNVHRNVHRKCTIFF